MEMEYDGCEFNTNEERLGYGKCQRQESDRKVCSEDLKCPYWHEPNEMYIPATIRLGKLEAMKFTGLQPMRFTRVEME